MPAPVRGLNQRGNGGWDVETDHGTIHAKHIVNAAGINSGYILIIVLACGYGYSKHEYLI